MRYHVDGHGNAIGYVVGNHPDNPDIVKHRANDFVGNFGAPGAYTRHCRGQVKYYHDGAYTRNMQEL